MDAAARRRGCGRVRGYESFTHAYDVSSGRWETLDRSSDRSLSFRLSGPIPGADGRRYSFFAAGEYLRSNSYLPHDWEIGYTGFVRAQTPER